MVQKDETGKITEGVIEKLVRQQVDIGEMQFGFMLRYGTTNFIFIQRQQQEKYLTKRNNLEKAFGRVPKDVV